jgi:hypothetical protein
MSNNQTAPLSSLNRVPREPYPGLRPFLDYEAALLFGRERQVREVIEHLRQTQFVAVLGGSGSGKSSLIHAGVVPALRSFGIAGAGDLWLPMTCTPGTNVGKDDMAARRHTPITRLARRFAALLRSRGSVEADAERQREIAEVFRQDAGFARLIDAYCTGPSNELAVAPGPDPEQARVLFVLDQFEEIFHPTNKGVADGALLVERVLDHFFKPHPRCHVVLTMRSEHLNDCASFLELPDAINKASYLIRRLDERELRDAIVGPAQRFLRLVTRDQESVATPASGPRLPSEVVFEPAVLDRLLRDVKAITHDPDHLPLLQHLLARLWEAALQREGALLLVPAHIQLGDLCHAVHATSAADAAQPMPLDDATNTLRASVENWPESKYRLMAAEHRRLLDALLCQLAFKDPNTGLYSQQRVAVQDPDTVRGVMGEGKTPADVRALIADGFLGSVDYMFWDDDDPSRVTLKVSHESFIRGWLHFRQIVDGESERFDHFVGLLRKTALWEANQRSGKFLIDEGELSRIGDDALVSRLASPMHRENWFRFLQMDRDGARLSLLGPQLDAYLGASQELLSSRRKRVKSLWWTRLVFGGLALVLLPAAAYSIFIQGPVTQRAELLFDAGNRANRAPLTPDYSGVGAAAVPLASLLRAAELIDDARTGGGTWMARVSEWLLNTLSWLPPVHRQDQFLSGVAAQSEPPVNGKLRQVLSTAIWHTEPRASDVSVMEAPTVLEDIACLPGPHEAAGADVLTGRLFVAATRVRDRVQRRAIFVPQLPENSDTGIALRAATFDASRQRCEYGPVAVPLPRFLQPRLVLDAALRYFAYSSAQGPRVEIASVTVQELDWDRVEGDKSRVVQSQTRAVISDASAVDLVREATATTAVAAVETWRTSAGRVMAVAGRPWRMVSATALRLAPLPGDKDVEQRFVSLQAAADGSACARLAAGLAPQPGFRPQMFESAAHCFFILRGNADSERTLPGPAPTRDQVLASVFEKPEREEFARLKENPPAPLASLSPFARVAPEDNSWVVGASGDYAGWLAVRSTDPEGRPGLVGLPWSTCALWRLGKQLQQNNAPGAGRALVSPVALPPDSRSGICKDR